MTQASYCWSCTPVGDGGPQSYSVEVVELINRIYGNTLPTNSGVVYWQDSTVFPGFAGPFGGTPLTSFLLNNGPIGGGQYRVRPGIGIVQGWVFVSDADVDFTINGGNANATDIIGLRRDLAGQTVRLFLGRGPASGTYSLVQTAATWEIPLAEVTLDGSGNYLSHVDVRKFATTPFYAPEPNAILTPFESGHDNGGGGPIYVTTIIVGTGFFQGVAGTASTDIGAQTYMKVPYDCINNEFDFNFYYWTQSAGNNIVWRLYYEGFQTGQAASAALTVANAGGLQSLNWNTLVGANITNVTTPGEIMKVTLERVGTAVNDTYTGPAYMQAVEMIYNSWNAQGLSRQLHTGLPIPS